MKTIAVAVVTAVIASASTAGAFIGGGGQAPSQWPFSNKKLSRIVLDLDQRIEVLDQHADDLRACIALPEHEEEACANEIP